MPSKETVPVKRWRQFTHRLQHSRYRLRRTWVYRLFGETLLHPSVWQFRPSTLAKGAALGLFVACTPTFGLQMILSAGLAILLRVNLPICLAANWMTNVATAPVFYYFCYRLGHLLVGGRLSASQAEAFSGKWHTFAQIAFPLWIGSLIIGAAVAIVGYVTVYYLCVLERRYRLKERLQMRLQHKKRQKSASQSRDWR
jgi:hypothetical protein